MSPATPALVTATKTAVFQLRAPSAWKRAALRDALKRTHLATDAALKALLERLPEIKALRGKMDRKAAMLAIAYATLRGRDLSMAGAAAARVDAIGMVEGYLASLKDGRKVASLPTVADLNPPPARYAEALSDLAGRHATIAEEAQARDDLHRLARVPRLRPLSLHGYGHFYRLLRHETPGGVSSIPSGPSAGSGRRPVTGQVYAWVNLLPRASRFTKPQGAMNRRAAAFPDGMIDVATGEAIRCKRPCWVLFPLSFGFSHHERRFLQAGMPGGGRLVWRPEAERFELHVSFTFETPAVATERRFLGVDRGLYNLAAWAATDADGALTAEGAVSGTELRFVQRRLEAARRDAQRRQARIKRSTKRAQADEAVHRTANAIVEAAREHAARVVLEELTFQRRTRALPKGDRGGRHGRAARRILGRQQYAKLTTVLAYKLPLAGLPQPVTVGAAYTSQTCPECGHRDAANRRKRRPPGTDIIVMDRFACMRCGHAGDADRNAARIIALKGAWLTQLPTRRERGGRPLAEVEKFERYVHDAIRRRGSGDGDARIFVTPDLA